MGTIYLVRHAQASFGADNYDQLSDLGMRQSERLGAFWRERFGPDFGFEAVLTGSLVRQVKTWEGIARGGGFDNERLAWPGLNEYDGEAVMLAMGLPRQSDTSTPEGYRQHFKLLREGLKRWMQGTLNPQGMPSWSEFVAGITSAFDWVRAHHPQGNVLIVSSGGTIAAALGHLLTANPHATIELNMRNRNTSVTEIACTPVRCTLVSFNALPHLNEAKYDSWVTHT